MFWSCQENSTTEKVIRELNKSLSSAKLEPEYFNKWNTTSVVCLLHPSVGLYGQEAKQIALEIFYLFSRWVKTQPAHYIPSNGIEPMYYPEVIEKLYWWACGFTNPFNLSNDQIINLVYSKIYQLEKAQGNYNMWYNTGLVTGLGVFVGLTYMYCPYFSS